MPRAYEAMRDKFAKTMPLKEAKGKAARIYNSKHKDAPVGRYSDKKAKRGR